MAKLSMSWFRALSFFLHMSAKLEVGRWYDIQGFGCLTGTALAEFVDLCFDAERDRD